MGIFFKVSDNKLLEVRNKVFRENGIPALEKNGFRRSPFSTAWFGKDDIGGFTYDMCRLSANSRLETVQTLIARGDRWIQIYLNIFELHPQVTSLEQLKGVDGLQYELPPNSLTRMRLRVDDFKGMPLFNFVEHKLKSFSSESGLNKSAEALGSLIEKDLTNIDSFIKRWHELHQINITDWTGNKMK
jgi:hypothetical protein